MRQHNRALELGGIEADAREHARAQQTLAIGKLGLDGQRTGGGIDIAVDLGGHPAVLVEAAIGQDQRQRKLAYVVEAAIGGAVALLLVGQPPRCVQVAALGDGNPHRNGVGARYHVEQPAVVALTDKIADLGLRQADQAAFGRVDPGVTQLDLRQFDLGSGRLHVTLRRIMVGDGGIQIQLADGVDLGQRPDAVQIRLGLDQTGLGLRLHRLGLGDLGLEGLRVDGIEQSPLVDEGTFLEMDPVEEAIDPGANGDIGGADGLTDHIQRNVHVLRGNGNEGNVQQGWRWCFLAVAATEQHMHNGERHARKQTLIDFFRHGASP